MRLRLVGYSGARPPVPGTEPVDPIDPNPEPDPPPDPGDIPAPLTLVLNNGDVFHKADYLAMGYNRFDVMCIGAAGGRGGGYHISFLQDIQKGSERDNPAPYYRYREHNWSFGPGGGGGGVHRVKGRLALLPTNAPVVVGQAGVDGDFVEHITDLLSLWDWASAPAPYDQAAINALYPPFSPGSDGGASSFGGVICRASGGKGAHLETSTEPYDPYMHTGGTHTGPVAGEGGVGGRTDPGGASTVSNPWDGKIGAGGNGGAGYAFGGTSAFGAAPTFLRNPDGSYYPGPVARVDFASPGGTGARSTTDPSTPGPGGPSGRTPVTYNTELIGYYPVQTDQYGNVIYRDTVGYPIVRGYTESKGVMPGAGGGAKPFLVNGDNTQFGSKAPGANPNGLVVVRLSYAIV